MRSWWKRRRVKKNREIEARREADWKKNCGKRGEREEDIDVRCSRWEDKLRGGNK